MPFLQVIFDIIFKRLVDLIKQLIKRYINAFLAQPQVLFDVLDTHYDITSAVFGTTGAKIGSHIYWPRSGIYCFDLELREIGADVVSASRSKIFTGLYLDALSCMFVIASSALQHARLRRPTQ